MLRILPLLLLFSYSCRAADVCLAWSPSDSPGVIGYRLYVDTSSMIGRTPAQSEDAYRIETVLGAAEVFLCVEKLTPGFTYYFRVTCFVDPADPRYTDKESDFSNEVSEVIPIIDWIAPVFSNVSCSVSETSATISWITDEPSDTQIDYGLTTDCPDSTPWDDSLSLRHSQTISGLLPGTIYHYRVRSMDGSFNQGISGDFSCITAGSGFPMPPTETIQNLRIERTQ